MTRPRSTSRRGFTLFEVALSLALVSMGVITVLMLLPAGIKAQHMARYQILASAKALEMVESYNASHNLNTMCDHEAWNPWDVHTSGNNLHPNLESRLSTQRFGMFPLPTTIARRLDSDGDEIQRVLDQGGYLYYSQPLATTGIQENGVSPTLQPNLAQRLIMAVVGYPQNNALIHLPEKAWPYYAPYPSPPVHYARKKNAYSDIAMYKNIPTGIWYMGDGLHWDVMLWEDLDLFGPPPAIAPTPPATNNHQLLRDVFDAYWKIYSIPLATKDPLTPPIDPLDPANIYYVTALAYADKIEAWCKAIGVPEACFNGQALLTDFPGNVDRHLQVAAARMMGHAGPILLRQRVPETTSTLIKFNATTVANMHENALFLGAQFAARYPYDWGAPRQYQRPIMMDFPLIEYDLLGPQRPPGKIFGTSVDAFQWRAVTPHPVENPGVSMSFPKNTGAAGFWNGVWGDSANNSTLTAPFEPAERCRQIVFWAVDWQSYEDFETAPSAPVDAGRYAKTAPRYKSLGPNGANGANATFIDLCNGSGNGSDWWWRDHHLFTYRNPEKAIVFTGNMASVATGTSTPPNTVPIGTQGSDTNSSIRDQGLVPPNFDNMKRFLGLWGADRNANQQLDRGTVPASVRMRASMVARFNYYDLRVPAMIH